MFETIFRIYRISGIKIWGRCAQQNAAMRTRTHFKSHFVSKQYRTCRPGPDLVIVASKLVFFSDWRLDALRLIRRKRICWFLLVVISLYLTNLGLVRSDRLTSIINYIYCFSSTLPQTLSCCIDQNMLGLTSFFNPLRFIEMLRKILKLATV